MTKNIYIVEDVLYDYTSGMVVIIAENLDECRSLFISEFAYGIEDDMIATNYDVAIAQGCYKVVPVGDNEESRIVSYVHGGA